MKIKASPTRTKTYVAIVLDSSGSMQNGKTETVTGFNEQIQSILSSKSDHQDIEVLVTTFSHRVAVLHDFVNIADIPELTEDDYIPNGMTAMYDGVGTSITSILARPDIDSPNTNVLVVVLSDGYENSSREYSKNTIAEMIQTVNETKRWTITYMGANQDLSVIAEELNIDVGNVMSFDASTSSGHGDGAMCRSMATSNFIAGAAAGDYESKTFYSSVAMDVNGDINDI